MNFKDLSEKDQIYYSNVMFKQLESAQDVKDWVRYFLDLEIPLEITDPDSNSSPLDAIWQVYNTFRTNSGDQNPGYILMSCREGMKTVSVAILELMLFLHFELEIAHAAATETQSSVGIQYIESFMFKIEPLLIARGWVNQTKNKRTIKWKSINGKFPFIKILICNPKGMNSLHSNVLFLDELDLADPKALKEAANIVGYSKGIYGVTVYLSTRKYAFGNMAAAIEKADETKYKIIRWNILDVTERCPAERHKPEEPKEERDVAKNLPLRQMDKTEYDAIPAIEQVKYEKVEAFTGCKSCLLLPVCKTRLAAKSATATGGFYKPIETVITSFRKNDPDTAEAQLMCWKPGSEGLVYPRFISTPLDKGNVISYKKAYETLIGPTDKTTISENTLLYEMQQLGIPFYAGVDWGYTHDFVICVVAVLPTGEVWLVDTYAAPGLEFVDQLEIAKTYRDKYKIQKWFVDQAMPSHMKSFNKNGMKCPAFTKDVLGGIESVRSKIVDASGKRLFKILYNDANKKTISAISKHRFTLDGQGNVTMHPDDERGIADICDTIRYIGQNMWPVRGHQKPVSVWTDIDAPNDRNQNPTATEQMKEEVAKRIADSGEFKNLTGKKGGLNWNF